MKHLVPKTAATVITAAAAMLAIPAMASAAPLHTAAKHSSTVTVSASPRDAVAGSTVKLTASIKTASPAPGGTVTFYWGSKKLCGPAKVTSKSAHCDTAFDAAGSYVVRGVYSGDAKHSGSTGKETVVATKAATSTTVSVSKTETTAGDAVTVNAAVSSHGPLTATGHVTFTSTNGTLCKNVSLSRGAAHCSYAWGTPGSYKVTATYSGDVAHSPSHGTSGTITVKAAPPSATTTTITGFAPTPVNAGASETVTVTVTSATGTPTGSVYVTAPGLSGVDCTATLSGGTGTCPLTLGDAFGETTFDATYTPASGSGYSGSKGTAKVEVRISTTTTVAFAAGTVTATVGNETMDNISSAADGGVAMVTFYTGAPGAGTAIAACTDLALVFTQTAAGPPPTGTNTSTCSSIPAGATTVYAVYSGDDLNQGSTSGTVDVTGGGGDD